MSRPALPHTRSYALKPATPSESDVGTVRSAGHIRKNSVSEEYQNHRFGTRYDSYGHKLFFAPEGQPVMHKSCVYTHHGNQRVTHLVLDLGVLILPFRTSPGLSPPKLRDPWGLMAQPIGKRPRLLQSLISFSAFRGSSRRR